MSERGRRLLSSHPLSGRCGAWRGCTRMNLSRRSLRRRDEGWAEALLARTAPTFQSRCCGPRRGTSRAGRTRRDAGGKPQSPSARLRASRSASLTGRHLTHDRALSRHCAPQHASHPRRARRTRRIRSRAGL
eukprot:scaffold26109_cov66-Phaeocystis_antarctica.AAC.3